MAPSEPTAKKKPTKAEQRAAVWASLNDRQQTYLLAIYEVDQEVEEWQRGAWAAGGRSKSADEWRWLDYGITSTRIPGANGHGLLQRRLTAAGVRDQGAGSTMAVLEKHGLILTRGELTAMQSVVMEVRLTTEGRAVARAGGADSARPARRRKPDQLSETLWDMLVDVVAAGEEGHVPYRGTFGGRHPAWDKLIKPGFVRERADQRLELTEAGRDHYVLGWRDYVQAYPDVNAVLPDGSQFWPQEIDLHLGRLRSACSSISWALDEVAAALVPPTEYGENEIDACPELSSVTELAHERFAAAQHARDVAAGQLPQLAALHNTAAARYLATVVTVVNAVANGADPVAALVVEPDTSAPVDLPRIKTGNPAVDKEIADVRSKLRRGKQPRRRGHAAGATVAITSDMLVSYADTLSRWLKSGLLARLMLRRDGHPTT